MDGSWVMMGQCVNGLCCAVMCSVTKSSVTFVLVTVNPLPLPLLCYRVTEHIIDDGSMGHDGSLGYGSRWVNWSWVMDHEK